MIFQVYLYQYKTKNQKRKQSSQWSIMQLWKKKVGDFYEPIMEWFPRYTANFKKKITKEYK